MTAGEVSSERVQLEKQFTTKKHEDHQSAVEACCGHRVHPDGDSPIIDSALNNFVFFVPFVVQLPNSG